MLALPSIIHGNSPVLESGSLGSVRGVRGNVHPYRDQLRRSLDGNVEPVFRRIRFSMIGGTSDGVQIVA